MKASNTEFEMELEFKDFNDMLTVLFANFSKKIIIEQAEPNKHQLYSYLVTLLDY